MSPKKTSSALAALLAIAPSLYASQQNYPAIVPGDILKIEDDSATTHRIRLIKITSATAKKIGYIELPGSYNYTIREGCDSSDYSCYSSTQRVNPTYGIETRNRDSLALTLAYMPADTLRKAILSKRNNVVILQRKRLLWGEALIDPRRAKSIPPFSTGSIIKIGYDKNIAILAKVIAVDNFGIHLIALDSTTKMTAFHDTSNPQSMIQDFITPHILIDYNDLIAIQTKGSLQVINTQTVYPWEKMAFYVWRELFNSKIEHKYKLTNWPPSSIIFPEEEIHESEDY